MIENPFSPRKEVLPPPQLEFWDSLKPSRKLGFVLYDGTAIALRLGHRISVDFDFFTENPLNKVQIREATAERNLRPRHQGESFSCGNQEVGRDRK
jgi:hypothetical protein